ncbi:MAG: ABC transporter substrate-binding protein [Acetobacteraceae bacterium]
MSLDELLGAQTVGRRTLLGAGAAALASGLGSPAVLAQSTAPVKVGVLLSFSSVFAALGDANLNGMRLFFDQIGWTAGGRRIEIIKEDDQINPQIGLQKLRKLVESDKVDIVCGPQASNVAMAMLEYVRQNRVFHLLSGAGVTAATRKQIPYLFRTSMSAWQHNHPFGEWFYDNLAKETVLTTSDFAGGRDVLNEFKASYTAKGGRVIKEIYAPLGTNDFSAYLADLASIAPPASFNGYAGTDAVRFVRQYAEYGLKDKTKLSGVGFGFESDTLPAEGAAALGAYNPLHYADTLDTPENKAFTTAYRESFNLYANCYAEYGFVTARVIAEILNATGGDTTDKDRMADAVLKLRFNAPRGPVSWDPATHNVIQNVYIRQVVGIDARFTNRVVATFPNVRDPGA